MLKSVRTLESPHRQVLTKRKPVEEENDSPKVKLEYKDGID